MVGRPSRAAAIKATQALTSSANIQNIPVRSGSKPSLSKRKRQPAEGIRRPKAEDVNDAEFTELPHNMGRIKKESGETKQVIPARKRSKKESSQEELRPNMRSYRLTPGRSPFPDWPSPTPEQCQEVVDILSGIHGKHEAPATIPAPSLTISGCGEVPSVLDALIRTVLSSATSKNNSAMAFQGLVAEFGLLDKGVGQGSVNWDAVRQADLSRVKGAIARGGLAPKKSVYIKGILDTVYEDQKDRANGDIILSLDHYHALSDEDAFEELLKYPGVAVKTAACVSLFCLRRPSFAVDTHVLRLCKLLGWVPANAVPNSTFSHCEVKIPDNFKYALHQLLMKHGQNCPRCKAGTGEKSKDWDLGCAIDHLVTRIEQKRKPGKQKVKAEQPLDDPSESEGTKDELLSIPSVNDAPPKPIQKAEEAEDAGFTATKGNGRKTRSAKG